MKARDGLLRLLGTATRVAVRPDLALRNGFHTAGATAHAVGERLVATVVDRVDLTPLIRQVVDLDSLVADVDIDAVAGRLDLVPLVENVLAEIDLPEIIRSSTGSVASSAVRGVRMQSLSGDEAVTRALRRLRSGPAGRAPRSAAEPS